MYRYKLQQILLIQQETLDLGFDYGCDSTYANFGFTQFSATDGIGSTPSTWIASSNSQSAVTTAIGSSANGDTVIIPNGAVTWSSTITLSKQITLEGANAGALVITDTNPNAESSPSCNGTAELICVNIGSSYHTTLANMNFFTGGGVGAGDYIVVQGASGLVPLMHDMLFDIPNFVLSHAVQWLVTGGVIWNTTFQSTQNLAGSCGQQVGSDSGSIVVKSNYNWDNPSTMGTLDTGGTANLYMENDTFSYAGQIPDIDDNGRIVIRYSTIANTSGGLTHGTTSTYGGRQVELYNNTYTYTNTNRNASRYFWFRAASAVVTANSFQLMSGPCYGTKDTLTFVVENAQANAQHGCCTGWMCFHQPGAGGSYPTVNTPTNIGSGNPAQIPGDAYQISDPVYIWNNTGTGQGSSHYGENEGSTGSACSNGVGTANFYQSGRDYFYNDSSTSAGAKPGWVPYTYPHPLRSGASVCTVSPTTLGPYTIGQVISQTFTNSNCTSSTWSSSGSFPTSLTFNTTTGVLAGTISGSAGTFTPSITYGSATNPYSIIVNATPSVTTSSLPTATATQTGYSQTIAISGGTVPVTCAVDSGFSGSGVVVNSNCTTGPNTIATAGSYTGHVTPTDTNSISGSAQAITLLVNAAPSITTGGTLPGGTVGTAYSQTLAATGGTTPLVWTLASGTEPPGLSLTTGGVISGTPTLASASPYSFSITATDANSVASTKAFTLLVSGTISVVNTGGMTGNGKLTGVGSVK